MLARPQDNALDAGPQQAARGTERLCAASGVVKPIDVMIRFVVSPDGAAIPDLKRRLPGRGIWITGTRAALCSAITRKAFARSFKREVRVAPDLVEMTERLIERAAQESLAMAHKAGRVAIGFAKVETAIAKGGLIALLHASDGAPDGVRKLAAALRQSGMDAQQVAIFDGFTSAQLDLALGRPNVVHAALLAGPDGKAFLARTARLERFRSGTNGTDRAKKPEE